MNTHEEYVTYAQAKALKELGFDWPCKAHYHPYPLDVTEQILSHGSATVRNSEAPGHWSVAPTQSVACRWLREEKGEHVEVSYVYRCRYYHLSNCDNIEHYLTYEEALSAGIDRALQLLKGGEK